MLKYRLSSLSARKSNRGGFTLVELLVVIAIIALLAGAAIGPITGALKIAKDNVGMQATHGLYVADFQYNIDNSNFADGTDAGLIAQALLKGGYITDASIFYVAGGATVKYAGAAPAAGIVAANVSWDFLGAGAAPSGLTTSDPDQLPLVWATGNTIVIPGAAGTYGTATLNAGGKNAYGTDGLPVAYKSGSSKFQKVTDVTTGTVDKFIDNSYNPAPGAVYLVRSGSK